jgi:hypothetical protein
MPEYAYQKMYVDEPDNWQDVDLEIVRDNLSGYYKNVDEALLVICQGSIIRTPFAFFRYVRKE